MKTTPLFLLLFALLTAALPAKDTAGSKDHSAFKRIEGSEIIWTKTAKFDEYNIPLERVEFDYDKQVMKATKQEKAARSSEAIRGRPETRRIRDPVYRGQ